MGKFFFFCKNAAETAGVKKSYTKIVCGESELGNEARECEPLVLAILPVLAF